MKHPIFVATLLVSMGVTVAHGWTLAKAHDPYAFIAAAVVAGCFGAMWLLGEEGEP